MAHSRSICVECRAVSKCQIPEHQDNHIDVGPRWRPPRKHNNRAWKRIANGELLWDRNAVAKADHFGMKLRPVGAKIGTWLNYLPKD